MARKLTDKSVKSLSKPAAGYSLVWDEEVKGLALRITATGARAFVLNYRRKSDGRERRWTIGSYPDWGAAAAREEAKRLKRLIDGGADPVGEHQSGRAAPTVNDLLDRFEREFLPRKRASTQKTYRDQIKSVIRPELGRMKVANVSFADIDGLHSKLSKRTPYRANRITALLSRIFTLAVKWRMRTDNPAKGIERNAEDKRQRYLSPDEFKRLANALDQHADQQSADIVRLLLLTGARRGEALQARWKDIDLDGGVWIKPGATTKQKTTHRLPLSDEARTLLKQIRRRVPPNVEWVFPAVDGSHRREVKQAWQSVCTTAKISGVRLHDMRHAYASVLASAGFSLPVIGALLGHTQPSTTARYVHLVGDPLREATQRASTIITGGSAQVIPLPGRRRG